MLKGRKRRGCKSANRGREAVLGEEMFVPWHEGKKGRDV